MWISQLRKLSLLLQRAYILKTLLETLVVITMEAAEGGLNIYYIANNASAIEAFHCPLK